MTPQFTNLTVDSKALYAQMIMAAEYENYYNVNGFNLALMKFTKEQRGNLSDLKKKGLVETSTDADTPGYLWVEFTDVETAIAIDTVLRG